MNTFEIVREMLVDQFKLEPARITLDATLESLDIDSLSAVEFMFLLEEKFEIGAPPESAGLRTIHDVVNQIERLKAAQRGAPAPKAVV